MPWEMDGPEQEVVAQLAAAIGIRCKSWRWRTHAWVRVGPLSCERACFSPRQEALVRGVS